MINCTNMGGCASMTKNTQQSETCPDCRRRHTRARTHTNTHTHTHTSAHSHSGSHSHSHLHSSPSSRLADLRSHSHSHQSTSASDPPHSYSSFLDILQWGNFQLFPGAFEDYENMNASATDAPDLSAVNALPHTHTHTHMMLDAFAR